MATCSKTGCVGKSSGGFENSRWMGKLSEKLREVPLNQLAIPGSHDSFTFCLDKYGPIARDQLPWIQKAGQMTRITGNIVYDWATVQSLSVRDQLDAGIRYFDIRVEVKCSVDFYAVHGLFGPMIESCLEEIASFLDENISEVVLLDFNHFYMDSEEEYLSLGRKIRKQFGSKVCPRMDVKKVTLNFMSKNGFQVIVFYHNTKEFTNNSKHLWPGNCIPSPWLQTEEVPVLLNKLEENFKKNRDMSKFYVTQGVLTPGCMYIVSHLYTTMKNTLVGEVARPFVEWLKSKQAGPGGINICIMDCVELENYIAEVIQLNYPHREPPDFVVAHRSVKILTSEELNELWN